MGVPGAVHEDALKKEAEGRIRQTSPHERAENLLRGAANAIEQSAWRLLAEHGYINPEYLWEIKGFTWRCWENRHYLEAVPADD